ncbi:MAG: isocitrate/isopropylmalate family dehydrogenase, partial [Candidatus Dadabacteria bacterium]|nr:isocitrate/isopropylmalate family dehydrogenase [Candidatus Dadabacteria bacterium]
MSSKQPQEGKKIQIDKENDCLIVPDNPIIPFIEGDGIGPDIWHASQIVFDTAIEKAYGGQKKIVWHEVLIGEKAFEETGEWLPDVTIEHLKEY